jgi:hypothetical protein
MPILSTSLVLLPKRYHAIAIFPFIFLRRGGAENEILINHERIHLRQQAELLVLPFYLWYLLEYLCKLVIYRSHNKAYRNISFEREAYRNDEDLGYLQNRKFWSFMKYLFRK